MDIKKTVVLEFCSAKRIKCTAKQDMPEYGLVAGRRFHLVHLRGNEYAIKFITVKARNNYKNGDIRFEVETNEGKAYVAYVRRDGQHQCTCKSSTRCYHLTILIDIENAQLARLRAQKMARQAIVAAAPIIDNPSMSANTPTLAGNDNTFHLMKPSTPRQNVIHA